MFGGREMGSGGKFVEAIPRQVERIVQINHVTALLDRRHVLSLALANRGVNRGEGTIWSFCGGKAKTWSFRQSQH